MNSLQQTMTYPSLQPHTQPQSPTQSSSTPTLAPPQDPSKHRARRGHSVGNSSRPSSDALPDLSQSFSSMNVSNPSNSKTNSDSDPFAEIAARHVLPAPTSNPPQQLYSQQPNFNPQSFPNAHPFNPFQNPQVYPQPMVDSYRVLF